MKRYPALASTLLLLLPAAPVLAAEAAAGEVSIQSATPLSSALIKDGQTPAKVIKYSSKAGAKEAVPSSTTWSTKDPSVTKETSSQVVDDTDSTVRRVVTVDNVDGHPQVTVTPVSSDTQAESVVAKEQKQPETIAVSVDSPMSITIDKAFPSSTYNWADTSSADPRRAEQARVYDLPTTSNFAKAGTWSHLEYAWGKGRGQGVIVAVVDTGVDGTHPDLAGQVLPGYDFVTGKTGAQAGWNDDHSHGTHVAGIIAAKDNNNLGITGVAPDVKILPIKVMDSTGSGSSSTVAKGVIKAVDMGANIISMSLGSPEPDPVLQTAVEYAQSQGVVVIAAGGNLGAPGYITTDGWSFPASYDGVIGVGSVETDCGGIGGTHIDISAPGCAILSTIPGGGYARYSGTSMATPEVSAAAAILLSEGVSATGIQNALQQGTGYPSTFASFDCVKQPAGSASDYVCTPNGTDWDLTRRMWGAGMLQLADAAAAASTAHVQGAFYPAVNEGRTVPARPLTTAPGTLAPPVNPWKAPVIAGPANVRLSEMGRSSVDVSWDTLADVNAYNLAVYEVASGKQATSVEQLTAEKTSMRLGPLTQGVQYEVRISAYLTNGKKTDATVSDKFTLKKVPAIPAAPVLSALTGDTAKLKISAPFDATSVRIDAVEAGTGTLVSVNVPTPTAYMSAYGTLTGLKRGSVYSVRAVGVNAVGDSTHSPALSVTPAGVLTMAPLTLTAGHLSEVVTFPADTAATSYRASVKVLSSPAGVNVPVPTQRFTGASLALTNLVEGARYCVSVAAVAGTSVGTYSPVAEFTGVRGSGAANVSITKAANSSITVTWDAVPAATGYKVVLKDMDTNLNVATVNSTSSPVTIARGAVGHSFTATVTATVNSAAGAPATSTPVRMLGTPLAPGTPTVKELTRTGATIAWAAARIPTGAAAVNGYKVTLSGATNATFDVPAGTLTYTLSGLTPGAAVQVSVAGVNADGIGTASAARALTPNGPSTPEGLNVKERSATGAVLAWTPVTGVSGYRVQFLDANATVVTMKTAGTAASTLAVTSLPTGAVSVRIGTSAGASYSDWSAPVALG